MLRTSQQQKLNSNANANDEDAGEEFEHQEAEKAIKDSVDPNEKGEVNNVRLKRLDKSTNSCVDMGEGSLRLMCDMTKK